MQLNEQLQRFFGFSVFREGQQETIENILNGHSSLAIFPTGSGKSLCYQLSALNLPHLTLVVSPLIALMHDQLSFLKSKGIAAACLDSSLTKEASAQVMEAAKCGQLKILMVSVERFKNERFRRFVNQITLSLLVVDEAHCISEWGHNFRPDYLKLPHYMQSLNIPQALLLTATAPNQVKKDMQQKFNIANEHVVQTGFYRANLDLTVEGVTVAQKDQRLIDIVTQENVATIVYVTLQYTAETVAQALVNQGINAVAYHAGLNNELRSGIQHKFMRDEIAVIVATIAFGMGIDKANIRRVIHYDLPKSIENYSQEIGRAGRDGSASSCIVFGELSGVSVLENFIYGDTPQLQNIQLAIDYIVNNSQHSQWEYQGLTLSNHANIRTLPLKTLLVALEMRGIVTPQYSYFSEYRFKFIEEKEAILSRFDQNRRVFLQSLFEQSQCKKVWCEPPFGKDKNPYYVDRDRAITALEYLDGMGLIELSVKGMTDVYQINTEQLRRKDLAQALADYFKQKEQAEVSRIGALVDFLQTDTCLSAVLCRYFDDLNAPEHCGHCSACRQGGVKLPMTRSMVQIDQVTLRQYSDEFVKAVTDNSSLDITVALLTRFLLGLTAPIFTRIKAKKLRGYGALQDWPYREVFDFVGSNTNCIK